MEKWKPKLDFIEYTTNVTMPIRDSQMRIAFQVIVYGVTLKDVAVIPGGSVPFRKAVERIGLSPEEYRAHLFDLIGAERKTR